MQEKNHCKFDVIFLTISLRKDQSAIVSMVDQCPEELVGVAVPLLFQMDLFETLFSTSKEPEASLSFRIVGPGKSLLGWVPKEQL